MQALEQEVGAEGEAHHRVVADIDVRSK